MNPDPLTEKKAKRFRFLNGLYTRTDGNEEDIVDMWEIGVAAGLTREDTDRVVQYLVGENLVQYVAMGGAIGITHFGVIQVERALSEPERPTEYFPPVVNIVHIGTMTGSSVQQGGSGGNFEASVQGADPVALRDLVHELKNALPELERANGRIDELRAHVITLEAQVALSSPNGPIVQEAFRTIRNILEGMASSILTSGLLQQVQAILP
jgi:hypothetical protein